MIDVRPFDSLSAWAVFQHLDPFDHLEAEVTRGAPVSALDLFADWRSIEAGRVLSYVASTLSGPFAVFGLYNSGQAGVAVAALLARSHRTYRRPLAALALRIRTEMPVMAARLGIHRIEARSWGQHPTAASLLSSLGFAHEADMAGFGSTGQAMFRQFAWTDPSVCSPSPMFRSKRT